MRENIADFVAAVQEGRTPQVDGVEARKSLLVIEALYASVTSGGWISVEEGVIPGITESNQLDDAVHR